MNSLTKDERFCLSYKWGLSAAPKDQEDVGKLVYCALAAESCQPWLLRNAGKVSVFFDSELLTENTGASYGVTAHDKWYFNFTPGMDMGFNVESIWHEVHHGFQYEQLGFKTWADVKQANSTARGMVAFSHLLEAASYTYQEIADAQPKPGDLDAMYKIRDRFDWHVDDLTASGSYALRALEFHYRTNLICERSNSLRREDFSLVDASRKILHAAPHTDSVNYCPDRTEGQWEGRLLAKLPTPVGDLMDLMTAFEKVEARNLRRLECCTTQDETRVAYRAYLKDHETGVASIEKSLERARQFMKNKPD